MPDWVKEVRGAIAGLNLEPTREQDVVDELSQHLRDRYEEMLASGVSEGQAVQSLRAELEDGRLLKGLTNTVAKAREPLAAGSSGQKRFFGGLGRDFRYAMRQLRQSPGFTVVAVLSLALGVGANTAIFQMLDAVRLRLLPVKSPEQLARVRITNGDSRTGNFLTNYADVTYGIWNLVREQQQGFSDIAAWSPVRRNLGQGGEARYADTLMVSGNFFPMLGVQPYVGRLLSPADDYRGCGAQGAVISYSFWQREYGGRDAALGSRIALGAGWDNNIDVPGGPQRQRTDFNLVWSGFFQTMRTPLLAGRDFNESDTPTSPRVAIVNETFARKYFQDANPVGKVVYDSGKPDKPYQIIGLVKDAKYYNLREDFLPTLFVAASQEKEPGEGLTLMIRSNESMESLAAEVKRTAANINPSMVLNLSVFKAQVREDLAGERLMTTLTSFFGALAILLAMVGIYGVISYMVVRRRSEIGIRMALGAARGAILRMVLRESVVLLAIGVAIGAGIALAAGSVAAYMLYGLKPRDPETFAISVLALTVIVLLASLLPAGRAANVDPMIVLREE